MMVRAVTVAVARAGFERARFLDETGLDPARLEDMHARMPIAEYQRVARRAYQLSRDPALGLHMGERMSLGSFDVLGHLLEHSSSLRDAIMLSIRFSRIVSDGPRLALDEPKEGTSATLRVLLPREDSHAALLAAEFGMVGLWRMFRSFVAEEELPLRAAFTHAEPAHRAEYTRIFGGREQFSQAFTGLEFERAWLERAPLTRPGDLREYLLKRAELLLAKVERDLPAADRVRSWLAAQSELARSSLDGVAHDLRTSTRSLRRRLQAERVQWSALLDDARAVQAKRMLAEPARSIQDTAYALGFRTPSAFSRAFKRWTGMAPKDYRSTR